MADMSELRLFTVSEANALIPQFEGFLTQIQLNFVKVQAILGPMTGAQPHELEVHLEQHPELRAHLAEIERYVKAIQETGAMFKALDMGLVDFPHAMGDQVVLLCWQFGEKEIRWWHPLEGNFAGRRPLPGAPQRSSLN